MLSKCFTRLISLVFLLSCIGVTAMAQENVVLPNVQSKDLNGREIILPKGLPAEKTLLFVAFERQQQSQIEQWKEGLQLGSKTDIAWLELPIIQNPGLVGRWFITKGMRHGIHEQEARAKVVTLYTDKKKLLNSLAIHSEKDIQILVINRDGKILAREIGNFAPEKAERLTVLLGEK